MQYRGAITVTAGTPASAPELRPVSICYGSLRRYSVYFPPGNGGTTYVQVWYRGRQILPTTPGATFRGDDLLIDLPDNYPLHDSPFELEIRGWSPAAAYDHTVFLLLYIETDTIAIPAPLESSAVAIPFFEES